ncbi:MAG: tetratricopeptide repeat protein [Candidatus Sumerlaeia bacterium]|nr:tetratricopeptide repeat protein [Candidatus Sumerlaeia bacterium]
MSETITKKQPPAVALEPEKNDFELRIELFLVWLSKYGRFILYAAAAVVFGYAGVTLWKNYQAAKVAEANDILSEGQESFRKAIGETAWASPERAELMRAAREKAAEVIQKFPGKPIAHTALLLQADAYFFAGDQLGTTTNNAEAIRLYEQFIQEAVSPWEEALGRLALGYAYENRLFLSDDQSLLQPALEAYDAVRKLEGVGYLKYEATNALARLNAAYGRNEQAIALYKETYDARASLQPDPADPAKITTQAQMIMDQLRQRAGAFTVAATARVQLQRLGVDMDAYDRERAPASP